MSATEADRIAGEGIAIQLGGRSRRLRYPMRALRYLEREFGSIEKWIAALKQPDWGDDRLRAMCAAFTAGLLHERPGDVSVRDFESNIEEELNDLEVADLMRALSGVDEALEESFPPPDPADSAHPKGKASGRPRSRGDASITSPRSGSLARTRRSGR